MPESPLPCSVHNIPTEVRRIARYLFPRFLHTPTLEEQGKSVRALGRLRHPASVAELAKIAQHPDKYLRLLVVESLATTALPEAIPVLRIFLADADIDVRGAAMRALVIIERPTPDGYFSTGGSSR